MNLRHPWIARFSPRSCRSMSFLDIVSILSHSRVARLSGPDASSLEPDPEPRAVLGTGEAVARFNIYVSGLRFVLDSTLTDGRHDWWWPPVLYPRLPSRKAPACSSLDCAQTRQQASPSPGLSSMALGFDAVALSSSAGTPSPLLS